MTDAPQPRAAIRVKLPCANEGDFRARFARGVAERGVAIPSPTLRPVGSRIRLVLELASGEVVSGEAVIDAHASFRGRPAMNARYVRFDEGSILFELPAAPPPLRAAPEGAPPPPAVIGDASASAIPEPAPSRAVLPPEALFEADDLAAAPPPGALASSQAPLADLPGRAAPLAPSPRARSRRPLALAAAAAAVAAVAAVTVLARRAPPAAVPAPAAVPVAPSAELAAEVAAADRRIADGRLSGPDAALEHLVRARRLAPSDAGVAERLRLVADTLEALGARALARGDAAEAAVHLTAAAEAAPDRESIRAKQAALLAVPRAGDAQVHRERGTSQAGPGR